MVTEWWWWWGVFMMYARGIWAQRLLSPSAGRGAVRLHQIHTAGLSFPSLCSQPPTRPAKPCLSPWPIVWVTSCSFPLCARVRRCERFFVLFCFVFFPFYHRIITTEFVLIWGERVLCEGFQAVSTDSSCLHLTVSSRSALKKRANWRCFHYPSLISRQILAQHSRCEK